mgnify:CR=1 FL=1
MANIKLRNVTKIYEPMHKKDRRFKAVDNFNLEINDGEFVIFVGPSGCGKSTTLRMIAGLEEITSGEIEINGTIVNKVHPKDRNIAMVFQNYALYAHMTVFENMAFGLKLKHVPKEEIRKKVNEAAAILGITDLLDRKPKQLSGGQRQRVALGRAIVRDPAVFLMDEPLSNLDAKLRVQMRTEITNLYKRLHATIIYVTHDQVEAMTMGTRIVVLKGGVIQQVDSPSELYKHPANMFVAGFIGSPAMNFFHGTVEKDGENAVINFAGNKIRLTPDRARMVLDAGYLGKKVVMGVRPEHIHAAEEVGDNAKYQKFTADIETVENLGADNLIYFNIENSFYCAKAGEDFAQKSGRVALALELERIHLFDPETQLTITNKKGV